MRPYVETIRPEPGASWAFLDRRLPACIPFEWHLHPEYELTLTLNSRGHRYIGDSVDAYEDGDLVLIGPGIPHSWCSREVIDPDQPHVALVVWFTGEWVSGLTMALPEMGQIVGLLARASQGVCFGATARDHAIPLVKAMRGAGGGSVCIALIGGSWPKGGWLLWREYPPYADIVSRDCRRVLDRRMST